MEQAFLELNHVSKTFPGVKALKDVRFDIRLGEVHALVGENGAGKSTLIKIMTGAHTPDTGSEIKVEGQAVKFTGVLDSLSQGISVIYQDFSLFGNLTVAENIVINQLIEGKRKVLNWKDMKIKAREALAVVNSNIDPMELVENLSVAKKQIVAIAGAIAQRSKMIIMDEPTSALSKSEIENLYLIIDKLRNDNMAVLFISHKMDEIFRVSDRITVFRDGTYIDTLNKTETNVEELIAKMVGRTVQIVNYANIEKKEEVVLEVEALTKEGNFKDISFKLYKGEVLGITGLVGAGRSELAQAIFGINKPDSGRIKINNEVVHINKTADAIKYKMGLVPESRQTQGLILDKTLADNIALPVLSRYQNKLGIVDLKNQSEDVERLMTLMDVRPNNPEMLGRQLSGGNQQKVVIAKWIGTNAKIMIVDEPTNGVDIGAKSKIYKILRNLAAEGTAVIVISSELPEILSVSDRILVMRRGRITGEFINQDVSQEILMEKALVKA